MSTNAITGFASQASVALGAVKDGDERQPMEAFAPCPLNAGGVTSNTEMVWLTGALTFPQASVARHVLFLTKVFPQPGVVVSSNAITGFASQASNAAGALKDGDVGQLMVAFAPCPLKTGGVISTTEMVWLTDVLTFPQASVARHVLFLT